MEHCEHARGAGGAGARFPAALLLLALATLVLTTPSQAQSGIYGFTGDDGTVVLSDAPADKRYKLLLRNADDFKLKASRDYRLRGPWAREEAREREPAPELATRPFHTEIMHAALTHKVDPALVHAVITAESAYNPTAVSPKGAVGLMQLMPDTARRYGVKDSKDPQANILGGVQYLNDLIALFKGDLKLVLAAYNAGENAVARFGGQIPPFAETRAYVPKVMGMYERWRNAEIR